MAIFELQTPDGRSFEVEAPDMDTAIQSLGMYQGNESDTGQQRGVFSDAIQQFGENFNRGLYATVNAPTSLANMATDALGIDYRFKRPLEAVVPGADREIMEVPEAQTAAGRVAGTIGEYAGANALPAGGMIAAAPRIAAATAGSTGLAGQTVNRLASGVAAAPGQAAMGELVSTVGAGTGAQVARDVAPGNVGAEFLAATAGGIAAPAAVALSPVNLARKGVKTVGRRVSPDAVARQQRRQVVAGIRQQMTPEAEDLIRESADMQNNIPGYRPSIAEATESPSFIATQKDFEAGLSGPDLDAAIRRYGSNDNAIRAAIAEQAPRSALSPDDMFADASRRPSRVRTTLDRKIGRIDDHARTMADRLSTPARQRDFGASIRDQFDIERSRIKSGMADMAQSMGLNDTRPKYRFDSAVKKRLTDAVELRSNLADPQARPTAITNAIDNMDDRVSITDLMELRSRVTDDIRAFKSRPDGKRRVQYLEKLKSELDRVSDTIIRETGDDRIADNWLRFRQSYRENLIEPFEQGAVGRIMSRDLSGTYRVPDEKIAREFFDGWNQTAAKQFVQTFPEGSGGRAALEAAALDDLHGFAVRDGIIDANRLATWMRNKAGILDDFPEIKHRVTGIENSVNELARRRAVLAQRKQTVDRAYLSRELARLDNPMSSTTPESIVDAAIRNPARMRSLLRSVKSDQAKDAIARHVWDQALSSGDPVQFLKINGMSVQQALGGERYKAATRLARAIEKSKIVPRPAGQPLDANPVAHVENMLGTGLNQISSRVFAVKSGRTSARYAFADIAGRYFRTMTGNQARQTLREAIYDPQAAIDLANALEAPTMMGRPQAKRLFTFLISNGIVATTDPNEGRQ